MYNTSLTSRANESCQAYKKAMASSCPELTKKEKEQILLLQSVLGRSLYAPMQLEEGISIIRENYPESFSNECQLDIKDEVSSYNKRKAYNDIDFKSWFAIRDYKEDGYVQINRFLRGLPLEDTKLQYKDILNRCENLFQAVNCLSVVQDSKEFDDFCDETLFRAETCSKKDIKHLKLEEGEVFECQAFFSTSEDEEALSDFCLHEEDLEQDQINIRYTIYRTSLLAGANISALIRDQEYEVLFPPKTRFIIQEVERKEKSISLTLVTENIDRNIWLKNFWKN